MEKQNSPLATIQNYTKCLKLCIGRLHNSSWINFNPDYALIKALQINIERNKHMSYDQLQQKSYTLLNITHRILYIVNRKKILFYHDTQNSQPYINELELLLILENKIVSLIQEAGKPYTLSFTNP